MKALLAEYSVFHDPVLAPEGEAMLRVLAESFKRCGYETVSPREGDFGEELRNLAPACDVGLVIAPDHLLARFTRIIEERTHNIGCGSMSVAVCANKQRTAAILSAHGIAVPDAATEGRRVIKEVCGCGTQNMRLTDEEPSPGEFGQQFIEGEHLSVSLIGSRVVGEACLYYSGTPPLVLSLNSQDIEIVEGRFCYRGGETPVDHPRSAEIIDVATRAATVLGCQGYAGVDVVVGDRVYVVDVNPRITSSLVGIASVMEEEIAALLVDASYGILPDRVALSGHVAFDTHGKVIPS
ncbi:MAG TPA: ATP-grasp domain-containing protein [Methanoculleus sp.]|nr:ATP-grasp domain-containing protein [Methanoculleus sp.]